MSRPPVVLIHGAGGCAAAWAPLLAAWGTGALAVDLPGRGASPGQPASSAASAAQVLRSGPPGALLVGHSLGGAVAMASALAHPKRWAGLVLVSSGARLKVAPTVLAQVAKATRANPFALTFAFGPDTDPEVVHNYQRATASTPPATTLADWQACDAFDMRSRLSELALPVLVVHGDADQLTPPRFQQRLADALPDGARASVPGMGHMLPWEAPRLLVELVRRWWADLP